MEGETGEGWDLDEAAGTSDTAIEGLYTEGAGLVERWQLGKRRWLGDSTVTCEDKEVARGGCCGRVGSGKDRGDTPVRIWDVALWHVTQKGGVTGKCDNVMNEEGMSVSHGC